MKKYDLMRSLLYIPAYNEKYILSALKSDADLLIFDLEDSVPFLKKEEARAQLIKMTQQIAQFSGQVIIRLNSLENIALVVEDLKYVDASIIDGLMLPKVNNSQDLLTYEELIFERFGENPFYFVPLIETALAMFSLKEIAQFEKVKSLAFGGEDYITDLQGKHGKSTTIFEYARAQIVIAARAFGKKAIDTPFLALDDHIGFLSSVENATELGFDGKQCIHPSQTQRLNQLMTPDEIEYEQSLKIISKIDEASQGGKGVIIFNGKMIGPPMVKRAQNIIKLYESIKVKNTSLQEG